MTAGRVLATAVAAILLIGPTHALAQSPERPITTDRPSPIRSGELTFDSLPEVFPTGSTKLVNGSLIVDLSAWEAILVARLDAGSFCSATIIGPTVMLTAAHCLDAGFGNGGDTVGGRVNIGGTQYNLTGCKMHDDYVAAPRQALDLPRSSEDFALCELDGEPQVTSETVVSSATVGRNSQLLMTGYGCTGIRVVANALAYDVSDRPGSERLRMGDSKIEAVNVKDHVLGGGQYLRVRSVRDEPILCPGDSGGPALVGASLALQTGPTRRLVGVNSMVTALPRGDRYDFLSYMANLGTPAFDDFARKWTGDSRARRICGRELQPGEGRCRP